ncbi:hypothetical protein Moror_8645 [Moniliophthora roreri MCA 2997]|uniref:Uncharacterized protein n=2 Tax=Moniliophthora roreri TaxID=221103 RepID=V2XAY6_MONRO|nr:hypothetical protein Moror_8645 [Moniliophthora roreri MCA 2997]KAI3601145.1 hypothetical protein WG66_001665 [Moniliophthora roreri]
MVMGPQLAAFLPLWVEGIGYGFFLCIYCVALYFIFSESLPRAARGKGRNNPMFLISTLMFMISTTHLTLSAWRLFKDYADKNNNSVLPVGRWDNILLTSLYVTQEILGSGAAIYRCWVLWDKSWKIVSFLLILFIPETVLGYLLPASFVHADWNKAIFDPRTPHFITAFYSLTVVLNITSTTLLAARLWTTHRRSCPYSVTNSILMPFMRILVESAALQLLAEAVLLGLFLVQSDAQYVFFTLVVPVVGITFTAITVRTKLVSLFNKKANQSNLLTVSTNLPSNQIQTIGSSPTRQLDVMSMTATHQDLEMGDIDADINSWQSSNKETTTVTTVTQ